MKTYFIVAQADTDSDGYLKNSTILCDEDFYDFECKPKD